MSNYSFKVIRGGIHSTFQDTGFENLQHLGITTGGVIDNNLFKIANKLVNNSLNTPVIEFAYQGPKFKLLNGTAHISITGNVHFTISNQNSSIIGVPFRSYVLKKNDTIDIIATKSSCYGYLAIEGGYDIKDYKGSFSTLVKSSIGSNNGSKIYENQLIGFNKQSKCKKMNSVSVPGNIQNNIIKVIEGPQFSFFDHKIINQFFTQSFKISNISDKMGIRLIGNKIKSLKSHNIQSEGIIKGSIQIPADGNPIILMSEHPTIGGYPKIATVILNDISKLGQIIPGKDIFFKKISIQDAEKIYYKNEKNLNDLFKSIKFI